MSKPHSQSEPSMEDILASIRKMISDEPSGQQRPMPDQMSRTPFGSDPAPAQEEQNAWGAEAAASLDASMGPSFSSLSDALKSSAPAGEQRSFEERIAGLVEDKDEPEAAASRAPVDPLSTFAARPGGMHAAPTGVPQPPKAPPAAPATPSPFDAHRSNLARVHAPDPGPLRNGDAGPSTPRISDLGDAIPQRSDALSPREEVKPVGLTPSGNDDAPLPFGTRSESQRVISIAPRGPSAFAPGVNGTPPGSEPKNGASVNGGSASPLGLRSTSTSPSPATRSLQERLKEKSPEETPTNDAKPALGELAGKKDALEDRPKPASMPPLKDEAAADPAKNAAPSGPPLGTASPVAPSLSGSSSPLGALGDAVKSAASAKGGPSEALVDAVVDLVQKDPSSMSVFTSGSAFIHGVGDKHGELVPEQLVPVPGQKLDGAAAELLRPMLRQWLAENMPRIVEEALRSELTSSEETEKDPKKS